MKSLYKQGLYLEYSTVAYNLIKAIISLWFGNRGNSIALIGFGLTVLSSHFLRWF